MKIILAMLVFVFSLTASTPQTTELEVRRATLAVAAQVITTPLEKMLTHTQQMLDTMSTLIDRLNAKHQADLEKIATENTQALARLTQSSRHATNSHTKAQLRANFDSQYNETTLRIKATSKKAHDAVTKASDKMAALDAEISMLKHTREFLSTVTAVDIGGISPQSTVYQPHSYFQFSDPESLIINRDPNALPDIACADGLDFAALVNQFPGLHFLAEDRSHMKKPPLNLIISHVGYSLFTRLSNPSTLGFRAMNTDHAKQSLAQLLPSFTDELSAFLNNFKGGTLTYKSFIVPFADLLTTHNPSTDSLENAEDDCYFSVCDPENNSIAGYKFSKKKMSFVEDNNRISAIVGDETVELAEICPYTALQHALLSKLLGQQSQVTTSLVVRSLTPFEQDAPLTADGVSCYWLVTANIPRDFSPEILSPQDCEAIIRKSGFLQSNPSHTQAAA